MGLLVLPMVIVGALVTLLVPRNHSLNGQTVLASTGSLFVTDSMSIGLFVLENKGERLKKLVGWLVSVVRAVAIRDRTLANLPRVSNAEISATSNATASDSGVGGVAAAGNVETRAKNLESLAGWVVLAGIDFDEQLRLALFQRNKRRKRRDNQRR